ncbi:hypothetical protein [Rhodocytophaga rosea]|uniref:hypothetical protein n=1 Tax=Rhodocytophaga rosea TaxID=2704465 RepID=UPI0037423137
MSRFIGNRIILIGVVTLLAGVSIGLFTQFKMQPILLFILVGVFILIELEFNK